MTTLTAVNTLEARIRKAESRLESLSRQFESSSDGQLSLCEVGRRLCRLRRACELVTRDADQLKERRGQLVDQLSVEVKLLRYVSAELQRQADSCNLPTSSPSTDDKVADDAGSAV